MPLVIVPVVYGTVWAGAALLAPEWVPGTQAQYMKEKLIAARLEYGPDVVLECLVGSLSCRVVLPKKKK